MLPYEVNSLLYGSGMSQLLSKSSMDNEYYYNTMRDKPISKNEIKDVLEYYNSTIILCSSSTDIDYDTDSGIERTIDMFQSVFIPQIDIEYPFSVHSNLLLNKYYVSHIDDAVISDIGLDGVRFGVNIGYSIRISNTPEDIMSTRRVEVEGLEFEAPDIEFIKEVYSRRLSLIRINPNYVREKVREYFTGCVIFLSKKEMIEGLRPYQLFLFLVSQCTALRIPYNNRVKLKSPIDNIITLNSEMIDIIYDYIDNKI